ncbi:hypothetical protein DND132_2220 [Pseudodesulfovibrio mercurii]|uniref:Acyltransferase 3 domain-containing protein n=1 Tax=Pseudodesulfovibrio mercurii TaxID=641491 RepID=F0JIJ0_9BACT|nr:acyltransferase [Pseudodesulfovibrio mercurii]EGB15424.1 hypothetical protein DND132_2220 [Pseudodesulfovibrio mercurii]
MDSSTRPAKVEYVNLYLLRLVAILLIVNAHMGEVYPRASMAMGGYLGNSLFYFVSAVGLSLSRSVNLSYLTWLKKRFFNLLLPIVILFALVELNPAKTWDILYNLLIPHSLAQKGNFFTNLVVLYLVFWPLQRLSFRALGWLLAGLMTVPCVLLALHAVPLNPGTSPAQAFFPVSAWMNFVSGMLVARLMQRGRFRAPGAAACAAGAALFVLCMAVHHALGRSSVDLVRLLAMHVNLLTVLALFYATLLANRLSADAPLAAAAKGLSLLSLPVYAIHFKVLHVIRPLDLNPYLKVALIVVVAFILAKLFDLVYSRIRDRGRKLMGLETA